MVAVVPERYPRGTMVSRVGTILDCLSLNLWGRVVSAGEFRKRRGLAFCRVVTCSGRAKGTRYVRGLAVSLDAGVSFHSCLGHITSTPLSYLQGCLIEFYPLPTPQVYFTTLS